MATYLLLILAGFAAGALNAVAGGGTFLSFPALVFAGVPPIMANASATLAALPGYVASAYAFRDDIRATRSLPLPVIFAASVLGSIVGACLLLLTPNETFNRIVPWLLGFATLAFALGPRLRRLSAKGRKAERPSGQSFGLSTGQSFGLTATTAILTLVTAYGGYFNGGVGILLLAAFSLIGLTNLAEMNGLKNLVSVILSGVSVVIYTSVGLIAWKEALVVALACSLGGYVGGRLSRRITRQDHLKTFIVATGLGMTLIFALR